MERAAPTEGERERGKIGRLKLAQWWEGEMEEVVRHYGGPAALECGLGSCPPPDGP